jgi:hypothetical protein
MRGARARTVKSAAVGVYEAETPPARTRQGTAAAPQEVRYVSVAPRRGAGSAKVGVVPSCAGARVHPVTGLKPNRPPDSALTASKPPNAKAA